MKRFSYLFFMLAVLIFSGCTNREPDPKEITLKFLSAIQQSDYNEAQKYATADSKSMLNALAAFQKILPEASQEKFKNGKITILHIKKSDSLAIVTYNSDQDTTRKTLKLKKLKRTWKVVFTTKTVLPDLHLPGIPEDSTLQKNESQIP